MTKKCTRCKKPADSMAHGYPLCDACWDLWLEVMDKEFQKFIKKK
jgi:hypothetical protein